MIGPLWFWVALRAVLAREVPYPDSSGSDRSPPRLGRETSPGWRPDYLPEYPNLLSKDVGAGDDGVVGAAPAYVQPWSASEYSGCTE